MYNTNNENANEWQGKHVLAYHYEKLKTNPVVTGDMVPDDGQQALTSIIRTPMDCDGVYMKAHGEVSVNAVKQEIRIV